MLETKKMGILIVGELFIRLSVELPLRLERSFAWNAPSLGLPASLQLGLPASLRLDRVPSVGPRLFGWTAPLQLDRVSSVGPRPLG